jgi:oligosaccharide repeat unit polymerase
MFSIVSRGLFKDRGSGKAVLWALAGLEILFLVASLILRVPILFALVMLVWLNMLAYACLRWKNRAAYISFLAAFFLFLLGGEFTAVYFGYPKDYNFTDYYNRHAYICLLISLVGLQIGYVTAEVAPSHILRNGKHLSRPARKAPDYSKIRKYSKILLYVTAVPYYLKALDIGLYVLQNGYLSYYTDYVTRLPGIVETLSEMFTMFLFIFLATMPKKKECALPLGLYFGCGLLSLMSGRRISFGVTILVIFTYVLLRCAITPEERWMRKRWGVAAVIACPLLVVGLCAFKYIRYGGTVEGTGFFDLFLRFFSQQGVSYDTIVFEKQLEGDSLGCTSLYYTIKYFRSNVLTRHLVNFPLEYYQTRSVETALYTNCLADYIQYSVKSSSYFAGYGLGTSYIAELYHDIGYVGLGVVSMVYGAILSLLYTTKRRGVWRWAIALMMLEEFVILPRYSADVILRPFYNLTKMLILVVFIVFLEKDRIRDFAARRRKNEH